MLHVSQVKVSYLTQEKTIADIDINSQKYQQDVQK